jgi:YD repeat-containing protein
VQNGGNNGQITGIGDSYDAGRTLSYTYDALGRLVTAGTTGSAAYPKWGLSFSYDRYGNRTSQSVTAGTAPANSVVMNSATNRITTAGYAYDANGNMTDDGSNSMVYDAENRVVSLTGSSGAASYSYNASGLRAIKVFGGITTNYVFDDNKDIAEYSNGTLGNEYVYFGSRPIAAHASGTLYYEVADHMSTRAFLDSTGNIYTQRGQYPFGEDWYLASMGNRHFATYERDAESGNDYAIRRFHVNRLGRFSGPSSNPGSLGDPQSGNLFSEARPDPVDPDNPFCDWAGWFCDDPTGGGDGGTTGGTGNGGNPNCNPDSPNVKECGGPSSPAPPPPTYRANCFSQMKYRPVTDPIGNLFGGTHSFWWVQDSAESQYIIAGARDPEGKQEYLNVWLSFPNAPHNPGDKLSSTTWYYSSVDPSQCYGVDLMLDQAIAFQNFRIHYDKKEAVYGPNSNSVARWLGRVGLQGKDGNEGNGIIDPPPGAYGWYEHVPGTSPD